MHVHLIGVCGTGMGSLVAVFEPRSATASRRLHQEEYPRAFAPADVAILAPVGRPEIEDDERLDVARIAAAIGPHASAPADLDAVLERTLEQSKPGDTVGLMSNGAFGGLHDRLLAALAARSAVRSRALEGKIDAPP